MEIENTFSTSVPGKNLKIKDYRLVFLFLKNKKWKPPPGHFQFLIFDFQNIENCFPISCFLETKIDDWDCKFVIFNSWGIKHWKSRLWIFDFQFSIWNKNQMDENHTDLKSYHRLFFTLSGKYTRLLVFQWIRFPCVFSVWDFDPQASVPWVLPCMAAENPPASTNKG